MSTYPVTTPESPERMLINQMDESWWRMQRVNVAEREQFHKSADRYGNTRKTPDEVTRKCAARPFPRSCSTTPVLPGVSPVPSTT
jgi:hypothetical protein